MVDALLSLLGATLDALHVFLVDWGVFILLGLLIWLTWKFIRAVPSVKPHRLQTTSHGTVRWNDVAGGSVGLRSGLQGFAELRQIRQNARRGLYDEAVRRARESAARVKDRRALAGDGAEFESDASPELAGQRI
jgi:hypothetical protein